jgi:hypothetical protein
VKEDSATITLDPVASATTEFQIAKPDGCRLGD